MCASVCGKPQFSFPGLWTENWDSQKSFDENFMACYCSQVSVFQPATAMRTARAEDSVVC